MAAGPLAPVVLDLEPFELLASVVELGSLSAAAARHGVSQPAISARMRTLEQRLGLPLLVRTHSGSRPTAEGAMMVKAAMRVLREAGALARTVEELRVAQRGTLRIAASLTVAEHLLPGWLASLHETKPGVEVELRVENSDRVAELIASGQADLGFVESAGEPAGLESEVVARDELFVVCAPSHRWASRRRPVSARGLGRTRLVVREPGAGGRQVLEQRLAELGIRAVPPAAEIASPAALRKAVAAGVAPGVVSEWAVRRDVERGRLRHVEIDGLDLHRDLRAVWRRGQRPMALDRMLGRA